MTDRESGNELQMLIEIGWRNKWSILVPFVIIFPLVTFWALYQPSLYRSSSSIFIEPQEVPADYVRSTITSDIEDRMRSIKQRLTSRTKLLAVINKLDLYPEAVESGTPSEVLVATMRKNLSVESPGLRDGNFFIVHYIHRDPTKAMLAVSNLVSMFVDESLEVRELQAKGTTAFIEEELEKLKSVLEEQEAEVQIYKKKYMGELPDQLEANMRMLDNLQFQVSTNGESRRELDGRAMVLEQEISRLEGELDVASSIASEDGNQPVTNTTLNQLIQQRDVLRQRIANMEAVYTERHPDLVAARNELGQVEQTLKKIQRDLKKNASAKVPATIPQLTGYSLELTNLRRQLAEIQPRITSLKQEEIDLRKRIKQYQKRIESAPMREQQLTRLTRDYENTKKNYEDLLNKKMEAQMSENLELRQKGEKFQILDPANFPEKAFLPKRPRLIAMGFAGGLGSGIGLALLLEALFPAFYSLQQVQRQTPDLPITFAIPHISSKGEHEKIIKRAALLFFISMWIAIVALMLIDKYMVDFSSVFKEIKINLRGMM